MTKTEKFILLITAALIVGTFVSLEVKREKEAKPAAARYIPFSERYLQKDYKISPYDSLIQAWSDSAGLDWRFVSAVIYHESKFRHDAVSRRGATGLTQMMPSTAKAFGADSLLDASESVMAGTRYLRSLSRQYSRIAANPEEQKKLTLAAYNAGGGRMRDLINYTRYRGLDPGYWDNIVSVIPEMREDSILTVDTVKLGKFQGHETITYVKAVMAKYQHYKRIAP